MILSQERKINEGGRYRQIERSKRQEGRIVGKKAIFKKLDESISPN